MGKQRPPRPPSTETLSGQPNNVIVSYGRPNSYSRQRSSTSSESTEKPSRKRELTREKAEKENKRFQALRKERTNYLAELKKLLPEANSKHAVGTLQAAIDFLLEQRESPQDELSLWEDSLLQITDRAAFILNWTGKMLCLTPACCRLLQFRNDEMVDKSILEFVYWKHVPIIMAWLFKAGDSEESFFMRTKDGKYVKVTASRRLVKNIIKGDVFVCAINSHSEPLTPSVLPTVSRKSQRLRYEVWSLHDMTMNTIFLWATTESVHGIPTEEWQKGRVMPQAIMYPDDAMVCNQLVQRSFAHGCRALIGSRMINQRDGFWEVGQGEILPCVDKQGNLFAFISHARDCEMDEMQNRLVEEDTQIVGTLDTAMHFLTEKLSETKIRAEKEAIDNLTREAVEEEKLLKEHSRLLEAMRSVRRPGISNRTSPRNVSHIHRSPSEASTVTSPPSVSSMSALISPTPPEPDMRVRAPSTDSTQQLGLDDDIARLWAGLNHADPSETHTHTHTHDIYVPPTTVPAATHPSRGGVPFASSELVRQGQGPDLRGAPHPATMSHLDSLLMEQALLDNIPVHGPAGRQQAPTNKRPVLPKDTHTGGSGEGWAGSGLDGGTWVPADEIAWLKDLVVFLGPQPHH